ncbi:hypothetical protein G7Y89_g12906 [Cudoniella acicularis]|uniref:Uncharacterized protein n=1 Tax=Cudoniella acicularis TaxID=354080 RepID=A0A8H4R891_9HELO|nr:hypothetical protein G7Y89_g12906 [Cudoniella acicularis]
MMVNLMDLLSGSVVVIILYYVFAFFCPKAAETQSSLSEPPAPYDEDTIISLVTELYKIFTKLNYIRLDFIQYTPPNGHRVNEALCFKLGLDPRVILLLKKLPHPISLEPSQEFELIPGSKAVVITDDEVLNEGRDLSDEKSEGNQLDRVRPQDIILTRGTGKAGSLVLDTQKNTIRIIPQSSGTAGLVQPEDAPTVLRRFINKFRTLEWIPCGKEGDRHIVTRQDEGPFPLQFYLTSTMSSYPIHEGLQFKTRPSVIYNAPEFYQPEKEFVRMVDSSHQEVSPVSPPKEALPDTDKRRYTFGIRRRLFWTLWGVFGSIVIIALICGVVLLSHKASQASNKSTSAASPATEASNVPQTSILSVTTNTLNSQTPTPTSSLTTTTSSLNLAIAATSSAQTTTLPSILATLAIPLSACTTAATLAACNSTDCSGFNSEDVLME